MCGCTWNFCCSRCRGAWLDPCYPLEEPETLADELERVRVDAADPSEFTGVL